MLLFDRPRQHDDLACAPRRQRKASRRRVHVRERSKLERSRPTSTRNRARCDSSAYLARNARARAYSSARPRAMLRRARVQARTKPDASRARPRCLRRARHDGMRPRRAPSKPATLQPPRAGGPLARHAQSGAPQACSGSDALSTSADERGDTRIARGAFGAASAARAVFARSRRIAIPATTSSWAALNAGGKGAGSSSASVRSASSRRPIRRRRRTSR